MNEALNLENFEAIFWTALLAPKGLSEDRVEKLRTAMKAVGENEELREKLAAQGVLLNVTDGEQTVQRMRQAVDTFAPIIEDFKAAQK